MEPTRELWQRIETLHAVTYFASQWISAAKSARLRGFWMGYFGFRTAPLGKVGAGVVEAAFANFAPNMVRRSIPEAWNFARPDDLAHGSIERRRRSAASAGARCLQFAPVISRLRDAGW